MRSDVHLDFETYSECDLRACGAEVYARHPSTTLLMLAYQIGDGPRKIWTTGNPDPTDLFEALADPDCRFYAFNAAFETAIWHHVAHLKFGWPPVRPGQWRCVMAASAHKGVATKLERTADMLKLDIRKDVQAGVDLRYISQPGTIPGTKGKVGRRQAVDRYERVMDYCLQDVAVEAAAHAIVGDLPEDELRVWQLDQGINQRGVGIDFDLCIKAIKLATEAIAKLSAEAKAICGSTPSQVKLYREWINQRLLSHNGTELLDLTADTVDAMIKVKGLPRDVHRLLVIRRDTSKSSVKKYQRAANVCCPDSRARGLLQYHGAMTGRWAGRLIQPQNLPRGNVAEMDELCELIKAGTSADTLEMIFGYDILTLLASACRGMIVAGPGKILASVDFSSIEAVVLACVAGEESKIQAFRDGECAYCKAAEKVFGYPVNKKEHPDERQVGKVCELAFGYQGGYMAWLNFDSSEKHTRTEIEGYRDQWRDAHPMVRALWNGLDDAAQRAVMNPGTVHTYRGIAYKVEGRWLKCKLPSGRKLHYLDPHMVMAKMPWKDREDKPVYKEAVEFTAYKEGRVQQVRGYGGHWTENVVQAVSRDIMVDAMLALIASGFKDEIILTVHDEIVLELHDNDDVSIEQIEHLMTTAPRGSYWEPWPIGAKGAMFKRYRK